MSDPTTSPDKCPKCGETGSSLVSWDCGTTFDLREEGLACLRRQLRAAEEQVAYEQERNRNNVAGYEQQLKDANARADGWWKLTNDIETAMGMTSTAVVPEARSAVEFGEELKARAEKAEAQRDSLRTDVERLTTLNGHLMEENAQVQARCEAFEGERKVSLCKIVALKVAADKLYAENQRLLALNKNLADQVAAKELTPKEPT